MGFKISAVDLNCIQTADVGYQITTRQDATDLVGSIGKVGLLQPPVLQPGADGGHRVLCGFRRIAACQTLQMSSIPARIVPAGWPQSVCAHIAISDNAFQRPLNVVEQSRAFALIRKFSDPAASWTEAAASVGLPGSPAVMERLAPVVEMPEALQTAILEGSVALPVALQIHRLGTDDAAALCLLFRTLTTNLNLQRELLSLISEIALREAVSIAGLIGQPSITAILEAGDASAPQKVHALRMMLKKRRYPELSRAERAYAQALESLQLNPSVRLHPPPFFEGSSYRLSLTIGSRQQLKTLLQVDLQKLIDHPNLLPE